MDANRKSWNERQQKLRRALGLGDIQRAIPLFLTQHAAVYPHTLAPENSWSFWDEVPARLPDEQWRIIPRGAQHSIAWLVWHMARTEDVTMNLLLARKPQVFERGGWFAKLNVSVRNNGSGMSFTDVMRVSETVHLPALRAYRLAVGRQTRRNVQKLQASQLGQIVGEERIAWAAQQSVLLDAANGVARYWQKLTLAGLLLMPPTRHNFIHLNQARLIVQKLKHS